jgi:hypothetical protein
LLPQSAIQALRETTSDSDPAVAAAAEQALITHDALAGKSAHAEPTEPPAPAIDDRTAPGWLAQACRVVARALAVIALAVGTVFTLFVGLEALSGEAGGPAFARYMICLVGLLLGIAIAFWNELVGSVIALASLFGSLSLAGQVLPGAARGQGLSLLVGPINLILAIGVPGYHPEASDVARSVPWISVLLTVAPALLFLASWWLRTRNKPAAVQTLKS